MLTARQRDVCREQVARCHAATIAAAFSCAAIGEAAMALLWPGAAGPLWLLVAANAGAAIVFAWRARMHARRIEALEFYAGSHR